MSKYTKLIVAVIVKSEDADEALHAMVDAVDEKFLSVTASVEEVMPSQLRPGAKK